MKKLFFIFFFMFIFILPLSATANDIFSYSFEDMNEASNWSGGLCDDTNSFENGNCLFLSNPFGEIKNNHVTHVLDYGPTITLEAGKVYTLSGYIMNPLSTYTPSIRSNAYLGEGANTIIISVSGVGDSWVEFSTTFFAGESGDYNLSLHFADGNFDFGFFVDELKLTETSCVLSSLEIDGAKEILIPATGSIKHYYRPYLVTTDNQIVNILSSSSVHFTVTDIPGITCNSSNYSISVSSAVSGQKDINISCSLKNSPLLPPVIFPIHLTDNMIENPCFDEDTLLWDGSSSITIQADEEQKYIKTLTNDYGEFGYFTSIKYDKSQLLLKDVLYVIRAKIKSDNPAPFSAIYAKNSAEVKNNTVYFSIKDISGEDWVDVFASFIPEDTGIYDIALNLCSSYDCTLFIDDIKLSSEVIAPEYITLHAPGNIALPNITTTYPVSALLRDQLGNIIPSEDIFISLSENDGSLTFDNESKLLTVNPDTTSGNYEFTATYIHDPSIKSKLDFSVSFDLIGDGEFETTIPNEWWMVSSPFECDFNMRHDGHSRRALVNCRGHYFMLLNNSYVHLIKNTPYVFSGAFAAPVNCTATLFLETLDNEMLPLAQFKIESGTTLQEKHSPELFLAEENAIGRPFLYVESDSGVPFSIYMDDFSLKGASIVAANPRITGTPFINGAAEAVFSLFNNITNDIDDSACAVNWYVSDSKQGPYKEVHSTGKNIYFDTTFLNKYVCFEVIPICPVTGFSGVPIRSFPFQVTYDTSEISSEMRFKPNLIPNDSDKLFFADTNSHWAEKSINLLAKNQIVSGKKENNFYPNAFITRAEFAKLLSTTFSLTTHVDLQSFYDVKHTDWFYDYVTSLYLAEIAHGDPNGFFLPDNHISREEATVMLIRLLEKSGIKSTGISETEPKFNDTQKISPWAINAIKKAVSLGLIEGNNKNNFSPKDNLTRAEACVLVCRLANLLNER